MFDWLKSMVTPPQPVGPTELLQSFSVSDATINQDAVSVEGDVWRIQAAGEESVRLFEVADPEIENCILTYRADLKTEDVTGRTYLEMWSRFPGRGEFYSKGVDQAVKGTNDWASYETPFFLKTGQKPDLIKLNLVSEGEGTLWLRNVELLQARLE